MSIYEQIDRIEARLGRAMTSDEHAKFLDAFHGYDPIAVRASLLRKGAKSVVQRVVRRGRVVEARVWPCRSVELPRAAMPWIIDGNPSMVAP